MAKKPEISLPRAKPRGSQKERERQLDSLYTYLGEFLFKNIENKSIDYRFEPEDKELEKQAAGLLQKTRMPEAPPAPAEKAVKTKGIDKRGLIEPYTKLRVELHEARKRLLTIKETIDEYLSLAMLHLSEASGKNTEKLLNKLKEIEDALVVLIENNSEVIRDIMGKKKNIIENSENTKDLQISGPEKEFLKKAAADIKGMARNIDTLAKEAKGLFRDIKHSYEKDLEAHRELQRGEEEAEEAEEKETAEGLEETEEAEESEEAAEEAVEEEEGEGEAEDYGLFETAARKLSRDSVGEDEKVKILNTLFRTAPAKAASFLYAMIKDAELLLKKQLIEILAGVDNPAVGKIYRDFIGDEESFLRLQGIMGLNRLKLDDAKKAIIAAVNDRDPLIRRLVANCLSSDAGSAEAAAIVRLTNDRDEGVARIAIRKLGKGRNRFSVMNLIPKLENPNIKIRKEAIAALQSITGNDLGYRYSAPEAERKKTARMWQKLWEKNQSNPHFLAELKTGHLSVDARPRGLGHRARDRRTTSKQ